MLQVHDILDDVPNERTKLPREFLRFLQPISITEGVPVPLGRRASQTFPPLQMGEHHHATVVCCVIKDWCVAIYRHFFARQQFCVIVLRVVREKGSLRAGEEKTFRQGARNHIMFIDHSSKVEPMRPRDPPLRRMSKGKPKEQGLTVATPAPQTRITHFKDRFEPGQSLKGVQPRITPEQRQ